jgi:3-hydroxyacyl-CoA dehydrogenase / 3-hydroxy-2-methylbutyryl-CoA dehydrogenase
MKLNDCVAVVTGGASGLGEATVRMLVAGGAKAAIWDMDAGKGESLAAELGAYSFFVPVDITSGENTQEAVNKTIERFGSIQIAVNCAGIGDPAKVLSKKGPQPLPVFERVIRINLIGTFNVIRLVVEKMALNTPNGEGERGLIINTASIAAFDGQIGQVAYGSSKAGVVGMTLPLAREFAGKGIRAVAIAPGLFDTPMMAQLPLEISEALGKSVPFPKRLGHPKEYAHLVKHIIENPMINGECIRLDGAIRMAAQ